MRGWRRVASHSHMHDVSAEVFAIQQQSKRVTEPPTGYCMSGPTTQAISLLYILLVMLVTFDISFDFSPNPPPTLNIITI